MRYSLIIKAVFPTNAREYIIDKLPPVRIVKVDLLADWDQVLVELESERGLANELNAWLVSERVTPYPLGSLLYWRQL